MNRKMCKKIIAVIFCAALLCSSCAKKQLAHATKQSLYSSHMLPAKHNFWIFLLAGQSNMAGRGVVEPRDTVSHSRVLALDSINHWVVAKEPLHFYEPRLKGLDCGLSFGKTLVSKLNDSIYVGIIPCAVGGSSVEQWLGDSLHRNVKLYTNFKNKIEQAQTHGTIKGILWHQGESNAHAKDFVLYEAKLTTLFQRFRNLAHNDSLPILTAELGHYLQGKEFQHYPDSVNAVLKRLSERDKNIKVISADGLQHKGDTLHFDSKSLRILGERFAGTYWTLVSSY